MIVDSIFCDCYCFFNYYIMIIINPIFIYDGNGLLEICAIHGGCRRISKRPRFPLFRQVLIAGGELRLEQSTGLCRSICHAGGTSVTTDGVGIVVVVVVIYILCRLFSYGNVFTAVYSFFYSHASTLF